MNITPLIRTLFISCAAAALFAGCSSNGAATDNQNNQNRAEHQQTDEKNKPHDTASGKQTNQDHPSKVEDQGGTNDDQSSAAPDGQDSQDNMDLSKEKAAEVLQKLKNTFMVETGKGGIVKNYDTINALLAHFKTVMSEDLAQSYLNVFFEMYDGKPKMIATEPPSWLEPDTDYQFKRLNPTTYHVVQRQISDLTGNREYTFELKYEGDHWIVNKISSVKIQKLTKNEAEEIVRQRLGNEIKQSTIVEYDHMEKDQYVVHVYDWIKDGQTTHTATYGWYKVNPATGEFTSLFGNNESMAEQIKERATYVRNALVKGDMATLANYVHPEKGLLISPYEHISDDAVVFKKEEIPSLLKMSKTIVWGNEDGSGKPMNSTPKEYFQRYQDFSNTDKGTFDDLKQRGNIPINIKDIFPNSHVVEFYHPGTEQNSKMDWSSLYIVFQKDSKGEWKTVALVSGQWTI
ncbi:hypothetical protein [Falsibacillus pallidus]|uniref:Lipoprotein n=1 Tax=Falsibacillus pallidus TaxID=493781 RepID=A0A370GCW3_9BACI|nr:hypothetical protein [Falsibacillus pallidus]RDI41672.1 hypothetical protein DFR59_107127 [Falsibacillus pallidus]